SAMMLGSCGTTKPSTPSSTNSRVAPAGPPTTGLPHAHASTITLPKLSRDEGTQRTVHAARRESRMDWDTDPSHLTFGPAFPKADELPLTSGPTNTNFASVCFSSIRAASM